MKILVCLTVVPDTTSKITTDSSGFNINYEGLTLIIGPYDEYALSRAIEIKESNGAIVDILHVGEENSEPILKKALALGIDNAFRVNISPTDSNQAAAEIVNFLKENSYDLILFGKESIDFNSAMVHHLVGKHLGINVYNPVMKLEVEGDKLKITTEISNGKADLEIGMPVILGCQEPIAEWKIPTMRGIMMARTKSILIIEPSSSSSKTLLSSSQVIKEREKMVISQENAGDLIDILKAKNIIN